MAFPWRANDGWLILVFWMLPPLIKKNPSSPHKKQNKKNVKVGPPLAKLSGSAHAAHMTLVLIPYVQNVLRGAKFWSELSSIISILCVFKQQRLLCAGSPEPLQLAEAIRTTILCAGPFGHTGCIYKIEVPAYFKLKHV